MNLNAHEGFSSLTENERYHAGYLNRLAEDRGWSKSDESSGNYFSFLDMTERFNQGDRQEAWLVESLMTALINPNYRTAFKAMIQAVRYDALAEAAKRTRYPDTLLTAIGRVLNWQDILLTAIGRVLNWQE